jgi:hypothetical protein
MVTVARAPGLMFSFAMIELRSPAKFFMRCQ